MSLTLNKHLITAVWTLNLPPVWINSPFLLFFSVLIICSSCCLWESLQELFDPTDSCVYVNLLISLFLSVLLSVITNRTCCVVMLNKYVLQRNKARQREKKSQYMVSVSSLHFWNSIAFYMCSEGAVSVDKVFNFCPFYIYICDLILIFIFFYRGQYGKDII